MQVVADSVIFIEYFNPRCRKICFPEKGQKRRNSSIDVEFKRYLFLTFFELSIKK